jgi:2-aminobenzoate-CoA ligase
VEQALACHPDVAECAVVGLADAERGMIVHAAVVLETGAEPGAAMVAALKEHVKQAIAPYKYPRSIEFVAELPRTETGKVQRYRLRQAHAEESATCVSR